MRRGCIDAPGRRFRSFQKRRPEKLVACAQPPRGSGERGILSSFPRLSAARRRRAYLDVSSCSRDRSRVRGGSLASGGPPRGGMLGPIQLRPALPWRGRRRMLLPDTALRGAGAASERRPIPLRWPHQPEKAASGAASDSTPGGDFNPACEGSASSLSPSPPEAWLDRLCRLHRLHVTGWRTGGLAGFGEFHTSTKSVHTSREACARRRRGGRLRGAAQSRAAVRSRPPHGRSLARRPRCERRRDATVLRGPEADRPRNGAGRGMCGR